MFCHFIITRFNVKVGLWETDKKGNQTKTDVWLKNRFELFEKYCLPSIVGQTNKNFTWLVLFDRVSMENYMHKIEAYKTACLQFHPCFFDELTQDELTKKLIAFISPILTDKYKYLITTRLDNDDAIHIEMIDSVQSCFPKENCFINFPCGYQYDTLHDRTYLLNYNNNHFTTRVEKINENFYTVMQYNHTKIDQFSTVYNVITNDVTPAWVETIHEKNIFNIVRKDAKLITVSSTFDGFYRNNHHKKNKLQIKRFEPYRVILKHDIINELSDG